MEGMLGSYKKVSDYEVPSDIIPELESVFNVSDDKIKINQVYKQIVNGTNYAVDVTLMPKCKNYIVTLYRPLPEDGIFQSLQLKKIVSV